MLTPQSVRATQARRSDILQVSHGAQEWPPSRPGVGGGNQRWGVSVRDIASQCEHTWASAGLCHMMTHLDAFRELVPQVLMLNPTPTSCLEPQGRGLDS